MTEPVQPTRNIYEIRQDRLITGWTVEFDRIKKRRILPLVLLLAILGMEVAHWFI